jgi:hypothetical protein
MIAVLNSDRISDSSNRDDTKNSGIEDQNDEEEGT